MTLNLTKSALAVLVAAALMTACGGGGGGAEDNPPAGNSPTSFTEGTIRGFGSIIVGGVRFDDSGASVLDDDGNRRSRDDLKLGMTVSIDSSVVTNGSAQAREIRFGSEIVGPIGTVDAVAGTFTVLGQTITVNASTVFDDSLAGGLSALSSGLVVEVYARQDAATGTYIATRIEDKAAPREYKLRGLVAGLDTTAKRFQIGSLIIDYTNAREVPSSLANGQQVKVKLQTSPVSGVWLATKVENGRDDIDDHDEAEVKGTVTSWTSATQFSVNGLPVDASAATFPEGTTGIVLGAFVEVEGAVRDGVLIATKVKPDDDADGDGDDDSSGDDNGGGDDDNGGDDDDNGGGDDDNGGGDDDNGGDDNGLGVELHGALSALDTGAKTFTLRGVKVNYAGAVFERGTEANLANGAEVEVEGELSADGSTVVATTVKFED